MADTCRQCDFYLDRGLASASSHPTSIDDFNYGGICRRHAPRIVDGAAQGERSQFPKVHPDQWCGNFRVEAREYSPC